MLSAVTLYLKKKLRADYVLSVQTDKGCMHVLQEVRAAVEADKNTRYMVVSCLFFDFDI